MEHYKLANFSACISCLIAQNIVIQHAAKCPERELKRTTKERFCGTSKVLELSSSICQWPNCLTF